MKIGSIFFLTLLVAIFNLLLLSQKAAAQKKRGEEYLQEGRRALDRGDWSEALKLYNKAVSATGGSEDALWGKALVYIRKGDYKAAKSHCKSFINKKKKSPLAHTCLGYAHLIWKRSSLAIASFQNALTLDPNFSLAICGIASAEVMAGNLKEGEAKFREALQKNPEEVEALIGLADLLVRLNRKKEVVALLEPLVGKFGDDPRFLFALGKAIGSGTEAEAYLRKALGIRVNWAEGHLLFAQILMANAKYDECQLAAQKAADLEPGLVEALKVKGMCQVRLQQYEEALLTLQEVMTKVPNAADAMYYIGLSYDALNEYEKAEEAYKKAMNMDLGYADPVISLGYLYYRTGKTTSAMSTMEKGVRMAPKSSLAYQIMADIYMERRSLAKAKEMYEKALKGDLAGVDVAYLKEKLKEAETSLKK